MSTNIGGRVLGLTVLDGDAEEYVTEHSREAIDLPQYYSRFEEEFGDNDEESYHPGPVTEKFGMSDGEEKTGLNGAPVEAALRALDGGGRYSRDDYTLHDCLPMPCVLVGTHAAIFIAPTFRPLSSGEDAESQ